jgi:hypothetical protein
MTYTNRADRRTLAVGATDPCRTTRCGGTGVLLSDGKKLRIVFVSENVLSDESPGRLPEIYLTVLDR